MFRARRNIRLENEIEVQYRLHAFSTLLFNYLVDVSQPSVLQHLLDELEGRKNHTKTEKNSGDAENNGERGG